jgi:hypothetical protein
MGLGIADRPRGDAATRRFVTFASSAVIVVVFLLRLAALAELIGVDQGIFITAGWGLRRRLMGATARTAAQTAPLGRSQQSD